jgi:hypothetical protein
VLIAVPVANDSDITITYHWQALVAGVWTNISGATSSTYAVSEANEGQKLRVKATSTDPDAGTVKATSAATAVVTDAPPSLSVSVSGTAQDGAVLTANPTVGSDGDGGTIAYRWQKLVGTSWKNIVGATNATYAVAETDENHALRVSATFTDDTGQSVSAVSVPTAPVDGGPVVTTAANILTTAGQIFAASSRFTASDPFGDAIAEYDFWDTGAGGGHFAMNNQAIGVNQEIFVVPQSLPQTTYVAGSGTDTLRVRVQEGGQWSPWSRFTVGDPAITGALLTQAIASFGPGGSGSADPAFVPQSQTGTVTTLVPPGH